MHLNLITIRREGYYGQGYKADPSKPLRCTVEVEGPLGKTELNLPPEAGQRIIELIAGELAGQARAVATAMTAQLIQGEAANVAIAAS